MRQLLSTEARPTNGGMLPPRRTTAPRWPTAVHRLERDRPPHSPPTPKRVRSRTWNYATVGARFEHRIRNAKDTGLKDRTLDDLSHPDLDRRRQAGHRTHRVDADARNISRRA